MPKSVRLSPPNSVFFLSDRQGGDIPDNDRITSVWSTPSCISFRCLMEQDGPTEVIVGPPAEVDPGGSPVFTGELVTPSRIVRLWTVDDEVVLEAAVVGAKTLVRIWANHPEEPDQVIIGLE